MKSPFALHSYNKKVRIKPGQKILKLDSGAECIYIQLSKKVGLKLFYKDPYKAKRSAWRQDKASRFNLAPKVLSGVNKYKLIIDRNDLIYLDQRDTILASCLFGKDMWYSNYPADNTFIFYGYKTEVAKDMHSKFRKTEGRIKSLRFALNTLVFKEVGFTDLMAGNNCGWIKDQLVAIDFGDLSV